MKRETNKQLVERIHPLAELRYRDCGVPRAGTYRVVTEIGGRVLGFGVTANQAWKNAADTVRAESEAQ